MKKINLLIVPLMGAMLVGCNETSAYRTDTGSVEENNTSTLTVPSDIDSVLSSLVCGASYYEIKAIYEKAEESENLYTYGSQSAISEQYEYGESLEDVTHTSLNASMSLKVYANSVKVTTIESTSLDFYKGNSYYDDEYGKLTTRYDFIDDDFKKIVTRAVYLNDTVSPVVRSVCDLYTHDYNLDNYMDYFTLGFEVPSFSTDSSSTIIPGFFSDGTLFVREKEETTTTTTIGEKTYDMKKVSIEDYYFKDNCLVKGVNYVNKEIIDGANTYPAELEYYVMEVSQENFGDFNRALIPEVTTVSHYVDD